MRRCQFVPDTVWVWGDDGWMVPLRREDDPGRWLALCESDEPIVTQVDDGEPWNGKGVQPTSSSTAPSLMVEMLSALDVRTGMSVLEVGTGTGYNAAMLAERAGAENVTTVEVDPGVAEHARQALVQAGLPVTVVTADGTLGHPANAPYDRVMVTASVSSIPRPWIDQTKPGGRLLLPWGGALYSGGVLLSLAVDKNGVATGGFGKDVAFMRLREQRPRHVPWADDERNGEFVESRTRADPREALRIGSASRFALGVRLDDVADGRTLNEDGTHTTRISHYESGSWAAFTPGHGEHTVRQHGPRRLWDELEAALAWWLAAGRPEPSRFGMTVTPERQQVWLDSPDHPCPGPTEP